MFIAASLSPCARASTRYPEPSCSENEAYTDVDPAVQVCPHWYNVHGWRLDGPVVVADTAVVRCRWLYSQFVGPFAKRHDRF